MLAASLRVAALLTPRKMLMALQRKKCWIYSFYETMIQQTKLLTHHPFFVFPFWNSLAIILIIPHHPHETRSEMDAATRLSAADSLDAMLHMVLFAVEVGLVGGC